MQRRASVDISRVDLCFFIWINYQQSTLKQVQSINGVTMWDAMKKQIVSWVIRKEYLIHGSILQLICKILNKYKSVLNQGNKIIKPLDLINNLFTAHKFNYSWNRTTSNSPRNKLTTLLTGPAGIVTLTLIMEEISEDIFSRARESSKLVPSHHSANLGKDLSQSRADPYTTSVTVQAETATSCTFCIKLVPTKVELQKAEINLITLNIWDHHQNLVIRSKNISPWPHKAHGEREWLHIHFINVIWTADCQPPENTKILINKWEARLPPQWEVHRGSNEIVKENWKFWWFFEMF